MATSPIMSGAGSSLETKLKKAKGEFFKGASKNTMSLVGHLTEIRRRLIICISCFILTMAVCFYYCQWFVGQLTQLAPNFNFIYIAPTELLLSYIRISIIGGIVVAFPVIGYHIWRFLCPGLTSKEKQACLAILTFGVLLFFGGAAFCYKIVMPISLDFLARTNTSQNIFGMLSIESYITFIVSMLVSFGVVFELPIITILLTKIGLLNPKFLKKNRKYVVLIIFILAAIITPPDITTQVLVAVPMIVLFEVSITISGILFRKKLQAVE